MDGLAGLARIFLGPNNPRAMEIVTLVALLIIGARLMSLATDLQAKAAALDAKADAVLAAVAALKASQTDPADTAALQDASAKLDSVTQKLTSIAP